MAEVETEMAYSDAHIAAYPDVEWEALARGAVPRSVLDQDADAVGVASGTVRRFLLLPWLGAVLVASTALYRPLFRFFTKEDRVLEWAQFAVLVLAVVILAAWRPFYVVLGALLYGSMISLDQTAQARNWDLPFLEADNVGYALSMIHGGLNQQTKFDPAKDAIVSEDLAQKFATEKETPYTRWVRSEGLDIISSFYVPDLHTVELKPWARRGGRRGGPRLGVLCPSPPPVRGGPARRRETAPRSRGGRGVGHLITPG